MANSAKVAGVDSYILYTKEATYGTPISTTTTSLSYIQSFSPSVKNNVISTRGFVGSAGDARAIQKFVPGPLDVTWSMDVIPNGFDMFRYALGTSVVTGSTYTYSKANVPPSFTMSHNVDNVTEPTKSILHFLVVSK